MGSQLRLRNKSKRPSWVIRSVDGKPFPVLPNTIVHEYWVIDRDSYEDTNGNLQRTILGAKDKFLLTFPAMTGEDTHKILRMVQGDYLTVEFEDFFNPNIIRQHTFYRGDVNKSPYQVFKDGSYLYDAGLSFNLIAYNTYRP